MKPATLILTALLCLAMGPSSGLADEGHKFYLTAKAEGGVPLYESMSTFSCEDKIYGVVEINRPGDSGEYLLQAIWRNPFGDDQEVTEYPFQLINGTARVWVWLELHRSAGSSLFQGMNPAGGLEEFAGDWQLLIRIDGQHLGNKQFELLC